MARATLRHDENSGKWVLACPRDREAHIFETTADPTIWPRMAKLPQPVKLICADPESEEPGHRRWSGGRWPPNYRSSTKLYRRPLTFFRLNGPTNVSGQWKHFSAAHGFPDGA